MRVPRPGGWTLLLGACLLMTGCDSAVKPPQGVTTPAAPIPEIRVADARTTDGSADAADTLRFVVSLSTAAVESVTVDYATVADTAKAGVDYSAQSGSLQFAPGETQHTVNVPVLVNAARSGDLRLRLQLANAQHAQLARDAAIGTIVYVQPRAAVEDASVHEGDIGDHNQLQFAVVLDKAGGQPISLDYQTANGSAVAGNDYVAVSGTLSYAPGETVKTVNVSVIGNEDVQPSRALTLKLANPQAVTLTRAQATGTITDDDTARQINIDDASAKRTDGQISFKLTLDRVSGRDISVDYATQDDTAKAGQDYVQTVGTLSFAAGEQQKMVSVRTVNDGSRTETASFKLLLSNPVHAALANGADQAVGTLQTTVPPAQGNMDLQVLPDLLTADRCDFLDTHYCLFPWPNDHFTVADASTDTGKRVNLNILSMPRNILGKPIDPTEWNRNDGFSPGQPILVRVPGLDVVKTGAVPITNIADSFRDAQPVVVIDAATGERQLIWSELDANLTKFTACDSIRPLDALLGLGSDAGVPAADQLRSFVDQLVSACKALPPVENPLNDPGPALIIRPAVNFKEGHRYIVALRNLKDGSGNILGASPAFQIYRDNHTSLLPQINDRRAHMEELFARLGAAGIARDSLYLAWDFTVASQRNLSERVLHMRDDALAALGDNTPGDGQVQGSAPVISQVTVSDSNSGNIAREVRGVITVPSYLSLPNGVAGSRLYYAPGASLPSRNPSTSTQTFDFLCRIPRRAFGGASDPASATVFERQRPSLYGHGLLGSKSEGGGQIGDMIQENGFIYCATDWIGMASHDSSIISGQLDTTYYDPPFGDVLNVFTILLDVSNFPTLADRVQQSLINFTYLGRAVLHPDGFCKLDAFKVNGQCLIDTRELFYDGNSQGGIIGGALVAISPDIKAGVLGVPGMNYSTLLQRSVDFDTYASILYASYGASLDQQFVLSLMQMLWDRAENDGYAQHLNATSPYANTPPKRILLTPAFGDHQVSMYTAEVMARTIGARLHCPAVVAGPDAQRGAAVQPGAHPAVVAEARARPDISHGRRHPDDEPYYGIACIPPNGYPYAGSALSVWDSGPIVRADGSPSPNGVAPPPVENRPPRPDLGYGADPHEFPRSTFEDRKMKSDFLRTGGAITDTCGGKPCVTRGFNPQP